MASTPADANHAASKAYVDAQVVGAGGMTNFSIVGDDSTGVTVGDGDDVKIAGGSNISAAVAEPDTITISLKNDLSNITSVTSDASNSNLTLKANGTGSISINNILTFSSNASTPSVVTAITKLYSKTVGGGGTGVFFINSAVGSGTEDELISKKKATALAIALG